MFDDIHEWPMVSTRGTARRGIDRREISIARSPGDSDGIRFGIRSSNANRSISSLKELHQILSGRSIMAGCLKPGARRAERLRGIKKAGARSGSMPFVSSSSPPAPVQWPYSWRGLPRFRVSRGPETADPARLWIDAWSLDRLSGPLREADRIRPIMKFSLLYG